MTDMMSPADMKAVMGGNEDCNGMNSWFWIIILFLFRGNMFGNGEGQPATSADIQRGFDNQAVINKLNGLESGLCDGFYAQNTSLLQGFNAQNVAMLQTANAQNIAGLESANETQRAIDACCCKTNLSILENRYADERNACNIINQIHEDGEKTRALITNNKIEDLQNKLLIANNTVQSRDFQLSQLAQTNSIENTILGKLGTYYTNPAFSPCNCFCG